MSQLLGHGRSPHLVPPLILDPARGTSSLLEGREDQCSQLCRFPCSCPPSTSQPGSGYSLPRSPFWYLRHYWEGTQDSHLAPEIF